MKLQFFIKWVSALKYKNFAQGKKYLRRNNTYSALGVLCEISKQGTWTPDPYEDGVYYYKIKGSTKPRQTVFPPDKVFEWAKMNREKAGLLSAYVAVLNDKGVSFLEIAKELEKKYYKKKNNSLMKKKKKDKKIISK